MFLLTQPGGIQPNGEKRKRMKPIVSEKRSSGLEVNLHKFLHDKLNIPVNQGKESDLLIEKLAEEFFEVEGKFLTFEQKKQIINDVSHGLTGYGPIAPLLADPRVSKVMVNGPNDVYMEVNGQIERTTIQFRDNLHVLRIIEEIVCPLGKRIDETNPMVDARLPDGSHVNAIIPPLALSGPTITITRFSGMPFTMYDLLRMKTLNKNMADFLRVAVESKLNIFISGGTGTGKTSTLNVLSSFIPNHERIVTIEDAAELKLTQNHVVSLESRQLNGEEQGEITVYDLIRNSLRMRPDRIIVGEVRGAEALAILQAMNTDHDGSLATVHANTPRDLLARLETKVLMAGLDLPVQAIRGQIAGALDLIIQQARMKGGSIKITRITEVLGVEGDAIILKDIFSYNETSNLATGQIEGKFTATEVCPHCIGRMEHAGYGICKTFWK